jgi:hypothetical protein
MQVKVEGAARKIDAIFRFDKELWKGIQKGVKGAAELVAADVRNRIPPIGLYSRRSRGWGTWVATKDGRDLGFDQNAIRGSVKTRFRSRYKGGFREVKGQAYSSSPAGAIYALAGSKSNDGFNAVLNIQRGSSVWPRAFTPAYYAKGPEASKEIGALIERAIDQVNRA